MQNLRFTTKPNINIPVSLNEQYTLNKGNVADSFYCKCNFVCN